MFFLNENTRLPMMYMQDALEATIQLIQAKESKITIRSSYNIAAIDFSPKEIAEEIKKHIPDFKITYATDFRKQIADSWPTSISDIEARKDWNWKHQFNLTTMTEDILKNI